MNWQHLWVVYRFDTYLDAKRRIEMLGEVDICVKMKEALPTEEEAKAEVARLTELNEKKGCKYFYQPVRFYPEGRTGWDATGAQTGRLRSDQPNLTRGPRKPDGSYGGVGPDPDSSRST